MIPNPSYLLDILPGHEPAWLGGLEEGFKTGLSDKDSGKKPMLAVSPMEGRSGTAVMYVRGGLYDWSYEYIKHVLARWDQNENVEQIVMDYDSPGGQAIGCQDCADAIKNTSTPVVAHVRAMAASAAYWLASAADEMQVKNDAVIGSVGTVVAHFDVSKMLDKFGVKVSFITAGEGKVDGNSYEPLSEAGQAKFQKMVDEHYQAFSGAVAENRGVTPKVVREEWQAHIYTGRESLENGMADSLLGDKPSKTIRRAYAKNSIRRRLTPRK